MCLFVLGVTASLQERSTAGWPEQDLFAGKSAMQGQQFHGATGLRTLAQGMNASDTALCPIGKPSVSGAREMRGSGAWSGESTGQVGPVWSTVQGGPPPRTPQHKYQLQVHDCEWTLAKSSLISSLDGGWPRWGGVGAETLCGGRKKSRGHAVWPTHTKHSNPVWADTSPEHSYRAAVGVGLMSGVLVEQLVSGV